MKVARVGAFEAVRMSEMVMVVRGVSSLGIRVDEVPELIRLLTQFVPTAGGTAPVAVTKGGTMAAETAPKTAGKRGGLWKRVRAFLHSADRAQGFDSILRAVADDVASQSRQGHPLRVVLGRRVATGDLKVSPSGRYRLP